jgi:hypothetical protein
LSPKTNAVPTIVSQVVLSIALPLPMIALLIFTRRSDIMGQFTNGRLTNIAAPKGRRKTVGPRLCQPAAWTAWTIKPTLNRNDEGPGFIPGLFLVPSHELSFFLLRVNCVPVFLVGRGDRFLAFPAAIV